MNHLLIKRLSSAKRKIFSASNSSRMGSKEAAGQYFLKAKNKQNQGRHLQALDFYIKATIYDADYFQAFCNMGTCYRSLGKYQESKNCYLRALKIYPKDAISNYNLANLLRIIGDYEHSIQHYNFIIGQQEKGEKQVGDLYVNSLINVGICYKNLGIYEEAISIYEKVNRIAANEEIGYYNHAMNILSLIRKNTVRKVNNFDVELADKATMLFDKVLELNPSNKIVRLAKLKLKVLVDRNTQVVSRSLQQLKSYQQESGFAELQEQLQETRSFIASFDTPKINLFQNLANLFKQNPVFSQNQDQSSNHSFSAFQDEKDSYLDNVFLTQQHGIQLITQGKFRQLETLLTAVNDSLVKGILELALILEKASKDSKYIDKAYDTYLKYFINPQTQQCIPFDCISSTGHHLIGKLLNLKNQFREASLHFQYSSHVLKRNAKSSATAHNDIAEGLEAAGSMKQAIEEYLLAFQLQPKNQKVSYNLGCCLFENGRLDEALEYFHVFMQTLQQNNELNASEKELWETECLILIALANTQKQEGLKSYLMAYDRLKQLRQKAGEPQLQQQHLFNFFQNLTTLLEEQFSSQHPYLNLQQLQQLLIDVYNELLSFSSCQDRQVITVNQGNLCYQSKRYLKAVEHFLQIKTTILIPYQKIALSYLRLIEPEMTFKYIELEQAIAKRSHRVHFIKDLIEWIYYNQNQGEYNRRLPAVREDLFYERNQYATSLIDKFQAEIKDRIIDSSAKISELTDELLTNPKKIKLNKDYQNIKFDKITSLLHKYPIKQPSNNNLIGPQILQICFNSNENIPNQLQNLIGLTNKLPNQGYTTNLIQALLHVFIYCNQKEIHTIKNQLNKYVKSNQKVISINLEKVGCSDEYLSIKPDFDSLKKLVILLRQWQQVLSAKTNQIMQIVTQIYYTTNIARCLQIEYNFPRHSYLAQCDQTFYKLVFIVMKVLKLDIKLNSKGSKLPQIKKELISQFQYKFNHQLKSIKLKPIYLNEQFVPITLTAYHHTKAESQLFIQTILKMTGRTEFIPEKCDYYQLIINKMVKLKCKWTVPFCNKTISAQIINKITQNPLYIANQSVLALTRLLPLLTMFSSVAPKFIKQDPTLQF